jgi:hypothetical protein
MKVPGLPSSYEKVGGIVYFGRMLDKVRLQAAGRLPDGYNLGTKVWTWFDARCTRFLAVIYETLAERVLHPRSTKYKGTRQKPNSYQYSTSGGRISS